MILGPKQYLDRFYALMYHFEPLQIPFERKLMRDYSVDLQKIPVQVVDDLRIAAGAEMRAVDVQLLRVADDRPVGRRWVLHDGELDEIAAFADRAQALVYRLGMPRRLDIHVTAIAVRQFENRLH